MFTTGRATPMQVSNVMQFRRPASYFLQDKGKNSAVRPASLEVKSQAHISFLKRWKASQGKEGIHVVDVELNICLRNKETTAKTHPDYKPVRKGKSFYHFFHNGSDCNDDYYYDYDYYCCGWCCCCYFLRTYKPTYANSACLCLLTSGLLQLMDTDEPPWGTRCKLSLNSPVWSNNDSKVRPHAVNTHHCTHAYAKWMYTHFSTSTHTTRTNKSKAKKKKSSVFCVSFFLLHRVETPNKAVRTEASASTTVLLQFNFNPTHVKYMEFFYLFAHLFTLICTLVNTYLHTC